LRVNERQTTGRTTLAGVVTGRLKHPRVASISEYAAIKLNDTQIASRGLRSFLPTPVHRGCGKLIPVVGTLNARLTLDCWPISSSHRESV